MKTKTVTHTVTYEVGNDPDCLQCQQGACGYHGSHEETYTYTTEEPDEEAETAFFEEEKHWQQRQGEWIG